MSSDVFEGFGSDQSVVLGTGAVLTEEVIMEAAQRMLDNFGKADPPYLVSPEIYAHLELHNNPVFYDVVIEAYVKYHGRVSKRRFNNIMKMRRRLFAKIMLEQMSEDNAYAVGRQLCMAMGPEEAERCLLHNYKDSPAKEAALDLITSKDPIRFTVDHVPTGFKLFKDEDDED